MSFRVKVYMSAQKTCIIFIAIIMFIACKKDISKLQEKLIVKQTFNSLEKNNSVEASKKVQDKKIKNVFASTLLQISDYWRKSVDLFKSCINELKIDSSLTELSTLSNENYKLYSAITQVLSIKPDLKKRSREISQAYSREFRIVEQGIGKNKFMKFKKYFFSYSGN